MKRTEILQYFINKINAKSYLEIGMGCGTNHNSIKCEYKVSVDPIPTRPVSFPMTSDDFFKQNDKMFDVIFIDGLHWSEQVYKDIINSLNVLSDGGVIVCHDLNPPDENHQIYPQPLTQANWNGDCWKGWIKLRGERDDLDMCVVDTDWGCGIITKGSQTKIIFNTLDWKYFSKNKVNLLNLISIDQFHKKYDSYGSR